jgi:hypothetical protein
MSDTDEREIADLTAAFFRLFSNRDAVPRLERIFDLFVPRGVIARCVGDEPEVSTLEEFIAPRQLLLTNGTLTDFAERELSGTTETWGNIGRRVCTYEKSGVREGLPFASRGVKIFQFVRTTRGWRILSVAWDDEREGFAAPDAL